MKSNSEFKHTALVDKKILDSREQDIVALEHSIKRSTTLSQKQQKEIQTVIDESLALRNHIKTLKASVTKQRKSISQVRTLCFAIVTPLSAAQVKEQLKKIHDLGNCYDKRRNSLIVQTDCFGEHEVMCSFSLRLKRRGITISTRPRTKLAKLSRFLRKFEKRKQQTSHSGKKCLTSTTSSNSSKISIKLLEMTRQFSRYFSTRENDNCTCI